MVKDYRGYGYSLKNNKGTVFGTVCRLESESAALEEASDRARIEGITGNGQVFDGNDITVLRMRYLDGGRV
jgi:hypothetical protein